MSQNKVIVVLGSGRSGTSLLTNILVKLGMETSKSLIETSEQNPKGFFEEHKIVEINKRFISWLGYHAYIPFPADAIKTKKKVPYTSELKEILTKKIASSETLWGFKDPRTTVLLPIWTQVFNTVKITPIYVLTIRDPAHVITSMNKQYSDPPMLSELAWLHRNCEALYHTGANCFIVHYEDWFTNNAVTIAQQLSTYTELAGIMKSSSSIEKRLSGVISSNLNRSVYNDYSIRNRYVNKLYTQLAQCRGDQFDRKALMRVVMECRKAMEEFSGWSNEAQRLYQTRRKETTQLRGSTMKQIDLNTENNNLRIRASIAKKELKECKSDAIHEIINAEKKVLLVRTSISYKIGNAFVKAFTKPGRNTLLLPFYILRIVLAK